MDNKKAALIKKLEALGTNRLAEALYTLSGRSESASNYVSMLVSSKTEAASRIQNFLESIACEDYFYDYHESGDLAEQLSGLLGDIQMNVTDPDEGLDIMTQFFEYDETVFEKCDDSDGEVAMVYQCDATDIFVDFASKCTDKNRVAKTVLALFLASNYGVRTHLLERAAEYLAKEHLLQLISMLETRITTSDETNYDHYHALLGLEILARITRNPELFESARLRMRPEISDGSCIDIARVYHECGRNEEALACIDRIQEADTWQDDEKDELLFAIYRDNGEPQKAEQAAWRLFERGHTLDRFDRLVSVIGAEHRNRLLDEQAKTLLEQDKYRQEDAAFLVDAGRSADAARYLIRWAQEINGNDYYSLVPIAQEMERCDEFLASTAIYRALLNAVLERSLSKAYHHAAAYLQNMDSQSELIQDWGAITPHDVFKESFHKKHKRKWRFWQIYEGH